VCLVKALARRQRYPGSYGLIGRFSDGDTDRLLKPLWRTVCTNAGVALDWNAEEGYDEMANGSRVYITGLKTQDQTSRYAKFRGLTLSDVYIDQAEELPYDVYQELVLRLSQNGFPHQILLSPQTVGEDHWIAREFPHDRALKPNRAYYALSTHDNAHNLPPNYIREMEEAHPPGTPIHATLILGKRGATIIGDPVYGTPSDGSRPGAFVRARHEGPVRFDPRLTLEVGLDFGKHHPCMVARQVSALGQVRYLGGLLGHDLNLDPFLGQVHRYLNLWFPEPAATAWCCDPAGVSNPVGVDMGKVLRAQGIDARYRVESNSPASRVALIERVSTQMRGRALDGEEQLRVASDDRWLRISAHGAVTHRMVADAFEFGYVWDPHMVSVGSKQMRRPKKDGWHEHSMNCLSGDTRVVTADGLVAIQDLAAQGGELRVLSRDGAWVTALLARRTRVGAPMVRLIFADGTSVTCTPDHRFLTPGGWKIARDMPGAACYNAVCQTIQKDRDFTSFRARSSGALGRITSAVSFGSIARFGWPRMALSLPGATSTMSTTTRTTTGWRTWSAFRALPIRAITASGPSADHHGPRLKPAAHGTVARKDWLGTAHTMRKTSEGNGLSAGRAPVHTVGRRSPAPFQTSRASFAARVVARKIARRVVLTTSNGRAWCAARLSRSIATLGRKLVAAPAPIATSVICVSLAPAPASEAYCLDVPGTHAFCIESGLVTHNCVEYLEANFGQGAGKKAAPEVGAKPLTIPTGPQGYLGL
jgi:hypothetical protein